MAHGSLSENDPYRVYKLCTMLLSKSAQIKCLGALLLCTSENGSGDTDIQYQFLPSESEGGSCGTHR